MEVTIKKRLSCDQKSEELLPKYFNNFKVKKFVTWDFNIISKR